MAAPTPDHVQAEIVADYEANIPVQRIIDTRGVSAPTLYKILRRHGIIPARPLRARDQDWTPTELERIAELHRDGAGVVEIMRAMGAGHVRVSRALHRLGVESDPAEKKKR